MFKLINKLKNRKGFTLIELIVVLAVLAIIMAIAVPRFLGVQEQAKEDADKSTLANIAKTAELYYAQGKIDNTDTWVSTSGGAVISGDLLTSLQKDLPDVDFQSKDNESDTLANVNLEIDPATGIATVSVGSGSTEIVYP